MQASVQIKKEVCVLSAKTICHACLSTGRNLNNLGQYFDVLRLICPNIPAAQNEEILFCWECLALLQRVKHFQRRVQIAQTFLRCSTGFNSMCVQSLSTLLPSDVTKTDSNDDIEDKQTPEHFEHSPDDNKVNLLLTDIKYENETDYDFDINFVPLEDIKEEFQDPVLKELEAKPVKRKKVKTEDNTIPAGPSKRCIRTYRKFENVVKKLPLVDESEVHDFIEKEKNTLYYKHLKNKCDKCVMSLGKKGSLKKHYSGLHMKTKRKPLVCDFCEQYFSTKQALAVHRLQHFFYYSCLECNYQCYSRENIRDHYVKSHDASVQCLECGGTFENTRSFYAHYKELHTVFQCDRCGKKTKAKRVLEKHLSRCLSSLKCDKCNITFSTYRTYSDHTKIKHKVERGETSYCVQCNLHFDNVHQLSRHLRTAVAHNRERTNGVRKRVPIACPSCPNVYTRRVYMMNHYRLVHANISKNQCHICQKSFLTGGRMREHIRYVHEGQEKKRDKICYICGRGFSNMRILDNHIRTHTGERPFECPHCDSKFAQKVALNSHVRFIHLKDKRRPDHALYTHTHNE